MDSALAPCTLLSLMMQCEIRELAAPAMPMAAPLPLPPPEHFVMRAFVNVPPRHQINRTPGWLLTLASTFERVRPLTSAPGCPSERKRVEL